MLFEIGPIYFVAIGLLLAFVFGSYLFIRKVLLGFREGFEGGRR